LFYVYCKKIKYFQKLYNYLFFNIIFFADKIEISLYFLTSIIILKRNLKNYNDKKQKMTKKKIKNKHNVKNEK